MPSATHKATDARVTGVELYLLPVTTRVPLKFGAETLTTVTCARARVWLTDRHGKSAAGWGETPLSVQWAWPSDVSYAERHAAMIAFCRRLAEAWCGHSMLGATPSKSAPTFQQRSAGPSWPTNSIANRAAGRPLPHLAALICCSAFDIAMHDAYGSLHDVPTYQTYNSQFMNSDLAEFLTPDADVSVDFRDQYPADYVSATPQQAAGVAPRRRPRSARRRATSRATSRTTAIRCCWPIGSSATASRA